MLSFVIIKAGDFFGERGFFSDALRETNIRSKTVTHLVYCNQEEFLQLVKNFSSDYVDLFYFIITSLIKCKK